LELKVLYCRSTGIDCDFVNYLGSEARCPHFYPIAACSQTGNLIQTILIGLCSALVTDSPVSEGYRNIKDDSAVRVGDSTPYGPGGLSVGIGRKNEFQCKTQHQPGTLHPAIPRTHFASTTDSESERNPGAPLSQHARSSSVIQQSVKLRRCPGF